MNQQIQPYMDSIKKFPLISRDEERKLLEDYQKTKNIKAKEKLVQANLKFVVSIAHKYAGSGLDLLDLIQEGNIGLMKAIDSFDLSNHCKLITYANLFVDSQIKDYTLKNWSLVRLGTGKRHRRLFYRVKNTLAKLEVLKGRSVSTEELASHMKIKVEDVAFVQKRLKVRDKSTSSFTTKHDADYLYTKPNHEEICDQKRKLELFSSKVERFKRTANQQEKEILEKRILSVEPESFASIGKRLGVSRQRIEQVQKRILDKLLKDFK